MLRTLLILIIAGSAFADDIILGPESTIHKSGKFLVISDGRNKLEYIVNPDWIALIASSHPNDNNSYTEIKLGLTECDKNTITIKIQQRIIPYETIRDAFLK